MKTTIGVGPSPAERPQVQSRPNEPGELVTPADTDAPSLTPQQIAEMSETFRNDASRYYMIWRECTDLVSGFRGFSSTTTTSQNGANNSMASFMRPRDCTVNLVQPQYRNVVARLSTVMPSWGTVPATEEPSSIAKSLASKQWLRYHHRQANVRRVLVEYAQWLVVHGTSALVTYMDSDNVRECAVEPYRIRAEPGIGDPNDSRFLGITKLTTKAALKQQFPDKTKEIDEAQPPPEYMAHGSNWVSRMPTDRVEVLEAYCRSGHSFLLVGTSGTVLAQNFTPGRCMPIQITRYTEIPGQFFGMGIVEMCAGPQYAHTTILNQVLRNARYMGNPKVLIHKQSHVDVNAFTTREGEKVLYDGVAPSIWTPPALAPYIPNMMPVLQSLIHDVTGIHTTSQGKRAVGVDSGRAIEALTANDLSQLQTTMDAITEAVVAMGKCALLYMRAYYSEEKVVREFDGAGPSIFTTLKTTDIEEDPDVFIEADTLFANDVADRRTQTLDLVKLGMMPIEVAKEKLAGDLDPMAPIKMIMDIKHAQEVLDSVIQLGDRVDGAGNVSGRAQLYPTDNLKVFDNVVHGFMQTDGFYDLQPDRQEAVARLYSQVLALMAPPAPMPGQPGGPSLQNVSKPVGNPGVETQPGALDLTQAPDAALDAAETADGVKR